MKRITISSEIEFRMDYEIEAKTYSSISMHEFLDFLKISCQLQESIDIDQRNNIKSDESQIDFNNLAKNSLVNSLIYAKSTPSPSTDSGENIGGNIYTANGESVKVSTFFGSHSNHFVVAINR